MAQRISGYGGLGGFGGGAGRDRAASFRRRHRVGQRVQGRVVKKLKPGLAWVLVDGHELLASLQTDPAESETLNFLVRQLDPEIVLQELTGGGGGLDVSGLAQVFWASRAKLEALAAEVSDSLEDIPADSRRRAYVEGLISLPASEKASPALAECLWCARETNRLLGGAGSFSYLPWLLAGAREIELAGFPTASGKTGKPGRGSLTEHRLSFRLPALGRAEVRLFVRLPRVGFRLYMEDLTHRERARRIMESALAGATNGFELECLGVERLDPWAPGALSRLLAPEPTPGGYLRSV